MEERVLNTEMGRKILALAKAGFKVSDLITDHIFREKIKSQILVVYETFLQKNNQKLLGEIDLLSDLFVLGNHLNLIKNEHLGYLNNGFLVLKSQVVLAINEQQPARVSGGRGRPPAPEKIREKKDKKPVEKKLNERQLKMMEYFEKNPRVEWEELAKLFPDYSGRTIRNELYELIENDKIKREGRGTYISKNLSRQSEESEESEI